MSISPQGLDQRCAQGAAAFLEDLLAAAVHLVIRAEAVAVPLLARFSAVELLDCTTLVLPDALGPWFPGCGGSSPQHTSAACHASGDNGPEIFGKGVPGIFGNRGPRP